MTTSNRVPCSAISAMAVFTSAFCHLQRSATLLSSALAAASEMAASDESIPITEAAPPFLAAVNPKPPEKQNASSTCDPRTYRLAAKRLSR